MSEPPGPLPDAPRSAGFFHRKPSIALNVATNWIWYGLVVISGFLIPRLIDQRFGPRLLGVWDLCWSLVVYVELLSLGVISAVGRFVARCRAAEDWGALNRVVNSGLLMLGASCLVALAAMSAVDWVRACTPPAQRDLLGIDERRLSLLLVAAAALSLPAGVYNSIITGWERFDLLNVIRWVRDVGGIVLMVGALYLGYGIVALGVIHFSLEALATLAKWRVARILFPQLSHGARHCSTATIGQLLGFGGKSVLQEFARGGLQQAATMIVSRFLGSEAAALFSRQRNLVLHAYRFTKQYAQVFVPTTAAMQAKDDQAGLRKILFDSSRGGFYVALPMLLTFVMVGGDLVQLWMGADYRAPWVLGILAVGFILTVGQQSTFSVLMGMGRHGTAAAAETTLAIAGILALLVFVGVLKGGMLAAAIVLAMTMSLGSGIVIPWYACRVVHASVWEYWRSALSGPLLAVSPYIAVVLLVQWLGPADYRARLALALVLGGAVLCTVYFRFVLPVAMRQAILRRIGLLPREAPSPVKAA